MLSQMAVFHLFYVEYYPFVYLYHIFIQSSFEGHLGVSLFWLPAMNKGALNMGIHKTLRLTIFKFGVYPEERLLGHMVAPFFIF